jgi:hypothetical protein
MGMIMRRETKCKHCGKTISCMGFREDVETFLKLEIKKHHKECSVKIREERVKYLLDKYRDDDNS